MEIFFNDRSLLKSQAKEEAIEKINSLIEILSKVEHIVRLINETNKVVFRVNRDVFYSKEISDGYNIENYLQENLRNPKAQALFYKYLRSPSVAENDNNTDENLYYMSSDIYLKLSENTFEKITEDEGFRGAISYIPNKALSISFINSGWDTTNIDVVYPNKEISIKNISKTEHIFELLEFFPIWVNYDFSKWRKEPFNDIKGKTKEKMKTYRNNAKYDVKVLPIAKLSDLVWLNFIGENEIWDNSDKTRTRAVLWQKFVDKLGTFPNDGEKEGKIKPIFEKIVNINQFQDAKPICSKPKRLIFTWNGDYYLLPDTQHGAFEVYNAKQVHQGEWHFYGDENMEKPAEKKRNICN